MWDIPDPNHLGASWAPKRNSKRKEQKLPSPRYQLEIRRVDAEIRQSQLSNAPIVAPSRVILSDFNASGVALFTTHLFPEGQEVAVTIEFPRRFFCKGRILSCHEYARDTRVLSAHGQSFRYRAIIQFIFDFEEDLAQVQRYCNDLEQQNWLISKRPRTAG